MIKMLMIYYYFLLYLYSCYCGYFNLNDKEYVLNKNNIIVVPGDLTNDS